MTKINAVKLLVRASTVTRERRDFIRIKGKENDTALSVQVCLTYTCCGVRIRNNLIFVYELVRSFMNIYVKNLSCTLHLLDVYVLRCAYTE